MTIYKKDLYLRQNSKGEGTKSSLFSFLQIHNFMADSKLHRLVEDYFATEGLNEFFWIGEKITGSKIEIFIDGDNGISFDMCKKVSRLIEAVIDSTGEYGTTYTLDVSSPGVGNALLMPRQYKKEIGRKIEVKVGEEKIKGILSKADDVSIVVDVEDVVLEGKKKKKVINHIDIPYTDIEVAKIKISF